MESDSGIKKCKNCDHDIILEGNLWIHITTSKRDGKGSFYIKGDADIICPICKCLKPEPES